jgi:superfamily II DNA or RNA helicase
MILRDYQSRDLDRIRGEFMRGCRCVVYTAPTGSGKTVLFVELVRRIRATRNQRVVIVVHRQELSIKLASRSPAPASATA